ncbi:hypothetical protein ACWCSH_46005, partial [Streptosporangium sp. NPDC001682]
AKGWIVYLQNTEHDRGLIRHRFGGGIPAEMTLRGLAAGQRVLSLPSTTVPLRTPRGLPPTRSTLSSASSSRTGG